MTRNQRRVKAKARLAAMIQLIEASKPKPTQIEVHKPRQDVFDVPRVIRGHREPIERLGTVSKGKFVQAAPREATPFKTGPSRGYYGNKRTW